MDLQTLGKRLRDARVNSGISQERAAEVIGAPRTAIANIEAGNRSVSSLELAKLAKLYIRNPADFLSDTDNATEKMPIAILRLSKESSDPEAIQREISRWVAVCQEGAQIEQLLGRKQRTGPPTYDVSPPRNVVDAIEQAEAVAEEERSRVGLGFGPIPDVADFLASQGIWAAGAALPAEMSGLFLHDATIGNVILVNFSHRRGRKRFSYAHEYAHALFDRRREFTFTSTTNAQELAEKRANAFAASFLVPRAGVEVFLASQNKGGASRRNFVVYDETTKSPIEAEYRQLVASQQVGYQDAALLAAHFGVSYQVAAYRLGNLGYASGAELKQLLDNTETALRYLKFIRRYEDVSGKPREGDRELVDQIVPLILEAYRREEISRGKVLDLCRQLEVKGTELVSFA
jgi:Zn-dependent peptidase ImmA (M78 family)/transcriptional regulator with XRE-family HTH domain